MWTILNMANNSELMRGETVTLYWVQLCPWYLIASIPVQPILNLMTLYPKEKRMRSHNLLASKGDHRSPSSHLDSCLKRALLQDPNTQGSDIWPLSLLRRVRLSILLQPKLLLGQYRLAFQPIPTDCHIEWCIIRQLIPRLWHPPIPTISHSLHSIGTTQLCFMESMLTKVWQRCHPSWIIHP